MARAQARQWAAELKAAQEKHARAYQGAPASGPVTPSRQPRQRKGSVPSLGTPSAALSHDAHSPAQRAAAQPDPAGVQNRLNLARALAQSIVESIASGDLHAARVAHQALGRLLDEA